MASNAATKATDTTTKKIMNDIAKEGIEISAEEIAMNMASSNPVQKAVGTGLQSSWGAKSPVARGVNTLRPKA
jgi:hypothetical protein